MRTLAAALAAICLSLSAARADGVFTGVDRFDLERPDIRRYVDATAAESGISAADLYHLLAKAEPQPKIIEAMQRPAEKVSPWWEYRKRFLTAQRIRDGAAFWQQHRELLDRVARERGVAISSDVVPWLIAHTSRDIRALLRLFDALDRHAFERKRAITLPLLRELESAGALIKSG